MTEPVKLTEAQYLALKKWEGEEALNEKALKVRYDVFRRLRNADLLKPSGWLTYRITEKGRKALDAFEESAARRAAR
jgi:hypothetical protein